MSLFRRMVEKDLDGVFLNPDEFADSHEVEGKEVKAMFQYENVLEGYEDIAAGSDTLKMYAKTADLPRKRMVGDTLNVDGVTYTVRQWEEAMGMTVVTLAVYSTY